jgi:prepilin-type N-terminal cleavage/methylation domain-containing protein
MTYSSTRVAGRSGFTLVEFMIVMVILGVVVAALVGMLNKQQRFYHGAREILDSRTYLREAGALLLTDLRTITPAGGDIYAWADNRIQFRMTTGSSVACRIVNAANQIVIPPVTVARSNTLSSWLTAPAGGDSVLIYDDGFDVAADDDFWRPYRIMGVTAVTAATGCPTGVFGAGGYMELSDAATPSTQLTLSAAIPASVARGAPVRIFRRAEYGLFQNASDQKWYLGFFDCLPTRAPNCTSYAAVSGPYRPFSSAVPGRSGLTFTYYDSLGTVLDPATGNKLQIARIAITARTLTESQISLAGGPGAQAADSLNFIVGLRNRR